MDNKMSYTELYGVFSHILILCFVGIISAWINRGPASERGYILRNVAIKSVHFIQLLYGVFVTLWKKACGAL